MSDFLANFFYWLKMAALVVFLAMAGGLTLTGYMAPYVLPLFIVFLVSLCPLLAKMSGWALLSAKYPADGAFAGSWKKHQTVVFRQIMCYTGCISIGCSESGIYLMVEPPFNIFHQPIMIPWRAMQGLPEGGVNRSWPMNVRLSDPPIEILLPACISRDLLTFQSNEANLWEKTDLP